MKVISQANIYVENKGIIKTDLQFDSKIVKIGNDLKGEKIYIPDNYIVVPGFIDEQVHGTNGYDMMDANIEALKNISYEILKEGTTAYLPATMTQSNEKIIASLKNVDNYIKTNNNEGATVLGAHLIGPFISKIHKGAQMEEFIQKPNIKVFETYNNACNNNIKLVTLSPEEEGGLELVKYLHEHNIVASIGHSDAKYEIIEKAIKSGLSCVTYVFNAQSVFHHRKMGVAGTALLEDSLSCEITIDGEHVCFPAVQLLLKNKPKDKIILITDSTRAKNLNVGESELGGQKIIIKNGAARLENEESTLAGSILHMNVAVKNVINNTNVDFTTAIDFATINPAKNLKLDNIMGSIKEGKLANMTVINKDTFEIYMTIVNGKILYQKK